MSWVPEIPPHSGYSGETVLFLRFLDLGCSGISIETPFESGSEFSPVALVLEFFNARRCDLDFSDGSRYSLARSLVIKVRTYSWVLYPIFPGLVRPVPLEPVEGLCGGGVGRRKHRRPVGLASVFYRRLS